MLYREILRAVPPIRPLFSSARTIHLATALGLAIALSAGPVQAMQCPGVSVSADKLDSDTKKGLAELERRFSTYTVDVNFASERTSILIRFAFANQKLLIDVFYSKYCELLADPNLNLPPSEQEERLTIAKSELYAKVPFSPIVAATKDLSSVPDRFTPIQLARADTELFDRRPRASDVDFTNILSLAAANSSGGEMEYLRDAPFVVTKANKHFVMVASASSLDAAIREMNRLKSKAPQYDFVVYGPYQGNPNYAIMMATWVPFAVAKDALENAKKDVSPGSMIWSCRSEGDSC